MRQIKCDLCGKQIDRKRECYYSIEEIAFNTPYAEYREIKFVAEDDVPEDQPREKHSWASYAILDFCETCWDSEAFKALRVIMDRDK
jgi:hypothetical protein